MIRKHVRRPEPMPRGQFHHIECDCGWRGKVPIFRRGRHLSAQELNDAADTVWLSHVPPRERRTYLLLDTRSPPGFLTLDEIRTDLKDQLVEKGSEINPMVVDLQARAKFQAQRPIIGNFLMPEGTPIRLVEVFERGGKDYGRFQVSPDGTTEELPIGEIRTPDGKVFCSE